MMAFLDPGFAERQLRQALFAIAFHGISPLVASLPACLPLRMPSTACRCGWQLGNADVVVTWKEAKH